MLRTLNNIDVTEIVWKLLKEVFTFVVIFCCVWVAVKVSTLVDFKVFALVMLGIIYVLMCKLSKDS